MNKSEKHPEYSIEKAFDERQYDCKDPRINLVVQLEVESSDVRCMKGDCCKDCSGNYYSG